MDFWGRVDVRMDKRTEWKMRREKTPCVPQHPFGLPCRGTFRFAPSMDADVPAKPSNRLAAMRRIVLSPQRGNNRYTVILATDPKQTLGASDGLERRGMGVQSKLPPICSLRRRAITDRGMGDTRGMPRRFFQYIRQSCYYFPFHAFLSRILFAGIVVGKASLPL
jgi:hypothetical protein